MPKLKYHLTNWERYWDAYDARSKRLSWFHRFPKWYKPRKYKSPAEIEKIKFETPAKPKIFVRGILFFLGITTYVCLQKAYIDFFWLRNPGEEIPIPRTLVWTFLWIARIKTFLWAELGIGLNFKDIKLKELTSTNLNIAPRKEAAMKALQIEKYQKERIDMFDFVYLGEKEDFSST